MPLSARVEAAAAAADRVASAAARTGWTPPAALRALDAADALLRALDVLGPAARTALLPALAATADLRALIAASLPPPPTSVPRPPAAAPAHRQPAYWVTRDARVAEMLWLGEQKGCGGEAAEQFAALPPKAKVEAMDRRGCPEDWPRLVAELARRYGKMRP
ncbi:hypothetical protein ACVW0K_007285 [Streptomyces filamentosus]